jgi:hypothetical protein
VTGKLPWRWASRLLWIALTLNVLYVARYALLMAVYDLIGGRDEESVIQFGHGNWMEFVFLWIMLSRQIPELLCLVVLCGSLFVVKRFERRDAGM